MFDALRTRAALGLDPSAVPLALVLPAGILLGPWFANLISRTALGHLDVVVSVALAILGVFVGIALGRKRPGTGRLLAAATAEGVITMATVATAAYLLLEAWELRAPLPNWLAAVALGVAAAASGAPGSSDQDGSQSSAARVADLDDVAPLVAGAVVLAFVVGHEPHVVRDLLLTMAVGAGAGAAGWLLLDRATDAERGVYVLGSLTLIGGASAYLGTSALLAGLVTGFVWSRTPGRTDQLAYADLRKFQHPLVVLLVVVAGARLEPTLAGVWLLAPYVVGRLAAKLAGGWVASRLAPELAPSDLGAHLLPPGVLGIALALSLQQASPETTAPLLVATALGTVASEVLAAAVRPVPR